VLQSLSKEEERKSADSVGSTVVISGISADLYMMNVIQEQDTGITLNVPEFPLSSEDK
jgi:hypothetical protein